MYRLYNDITHVTNCMFNNELLRQKMVADIMGHPVVKLTKILSAVVLEISLTKYFIGKNGQMKRMISMRMLILSYTIQQVVPNVCTIFQNPRRIGSLEILDEKKNKFTHRQTQRQILLRKRRKLFIPLQTSYYLNICLCD